MARPRAFHDSDILTRAMFAFWQHGYSGTQVRQLEQATGLRVSSLYNRFDSKESLFLEVLDHYLERVVRRRIQRYLESGDPVNGIRRFFDTTYEYLAEARDPFPLACLLTNTALELAADNAPVRARINAGMAEVEQGFASALQRARDAGQLPAHTDTHACARQLLLALQGVLVQSRLNPEAGFLRDCVDAALAPIPFTTLTGAPDESPAYPR